MIEAIAGPDIVEESAHPDAEPTQPHLLPGNGPAALGDHREVAAEALLQHERAPVALPGVVTNRGGVPFRVFRAETDHKVVFHAGLEPHIGAEFRTRPWEIFVRIAGNMGVYRCV